MAELLCREDAYLRRTETEVLGVTPAGKQWLVELAESPFYPEGGGQPTDHGRIGAASVLDVCVSPDGRLLHRTDLALPLGPATAEVDWERRLDHMQQHTGQHLLTAVAQDRFGWNTLAFHLGPDRCDIELDTPPPTPEQLRSLEDAVATEIAANRAVRPTTVSREEFDHLDVRTRGLPSGHTGAIRLVEIAGLDLNTCGGTHLSSLGELRSLCLLGSEKLRDGCRLFFVAGDRVRRRLGTLQQREQQLAVILGRPAPELVDETARILESARDRERRQRGLLGELAELLGQGLAQSQKAVPHLTRPEQDISLLSRIASAAGDRPLLLGGGSQEGVFLLQAPPEVLARARNEILSLLGGRGGGRPGRLQGKASQLDRLGEAAEALARALDAEET